MSELAPSPAERMIRRGALAAMIAMAAALVLLGVALYRPSLASAEPTSSSNPNVELNARSGNP